MGRKQQKPDPEARQHALRCIPVRGPHVSVQEQDNQELLLRYPVEIKPLFAGIFKRFSGTETSTTYRKLQLDTLGSETWRMIDGSSTVGEIITSFQKKHQLDQREAEVAITTFLRQLGQRGLIAMREK